MRIRQLLPALVLAGLSLAEAQSPTVYDALVEAGDMPGLVHVLASDDAPLEGRDWAGAIARLTLGAEASDAEQVGAWMEEATGLNPDQERQVFEALADRAFLETRYSDAVDALDHVLALTQDEAERAEITRVQAFDRVAGPVPPISVAGASGASLAVTRDMADQMRIDVGLGGTAPVPMLVDTGAEISVIMDRHARAAGLRFLEGEVQVGTVTEDVTGRLAVADQLDLGGVLVRNVVFLVLPDDELVFADGAYEVDGILGLQVYAAIGRIGWSERSTRLSFGDAIPALDAASARLYRHQDGLGLEVMLGMQPAPAFFDSGASRTIFRPGLLTHLDEAEQARLVQSERTRTGLGGAESIATRQLDTLMLGVGGAELVYIDLTIDPPEEDQPSGDIAAIGNDLIRSADQVTLDFQAMRYRVVLAD
tara:strand:- start:1611 stop:2879 length:1269 start_codon:yes stop_codon:yes gene_type:complete